MNATNKGAERPVRSRDVDAKSEAQAQRWLRTHCVGCGEHKGKARRALVLCARCQATEDKRQIITAEVPHA